MMVLFGRSPIATTPQKAQKAPFICHVYKYTTLYKKPEKRLLNALQGHTPKKPQKAARNGRKVRASPENVKKV